MQNQSHGEVWKKAFLTLMGPHTTYKTCSVPQGNTVTGVLGYQELVK